MTRYVSAAVLRDSAERASGTHNRDATVEFNEWQRYPWELRCYSQGRCTTTKGMPCYYSTEEDAKRAGFVWVTTGVATADQRETA